MKQKEIKEIARIINRYSEEIVPDLEDGKPIPTDVNVFVNSKVLSQALADYFEREEGYQCGSCEQQFDELKDGSCPKCSSGNWVRGCIDEKGFNREQFLKDCGIE